jgi:hypothetical protein
MIGGGEESRQMLQHYNKEWGIKGQERRIFF